MSGDGDEDGDGKPEYVKKEFVAREWPLTSGVYDEVKQSIVEPSRSRLSMRISRQRRDFGNDGFNFVDKDGAEFSVDLKGIVKNINPSRHRKKIIEGGFQVAHQIKQIQTQTYFGRAVNKAS
jgi:WD40 repeat protein